MCQQNDECITMEKKFHIFNNKETSFTHKQLFIGGFFNFCQFTIVSNENNIVKN